MKLSIIAHPNSKRPRVFKDSSGLLHIYVSQPAMEDKANQAVLEALAEYFKISKAKISLIHGAKSKQKVFRLDI